MKRKRNIHVTDMGKRLTNAFDSRLRVLLSAHFQEDKGNLIQEITYWQDLCKVTEGKKKNYLWQRKTKAFPPSVLLDCFSNSKFLR